MFCIQTEEFLREKGVDFTIRNIADGDEEVSLSWSVWVR
jgi:hypothetical protein